MSIKLGPCGMQCWACGAPQGCTSFYGESEKVPVSLCHRCLAKMAEVVGDEYRRLNPNRVRANSLKLDAAWANLIAVWEEVRLEEEPKP